MITFATFSIWRFVLGFPFIGLALGSIWIFYSSDIFLSKDRPTLAPWVLALLLFWTLFPPLWFFTEYFGVASGALQITDSNNDCDKIKDTLEKLTDYGDLASKIWAAFLGVYVFTITQRVKEREEEIEREDKNPELP